MWQARANRRMISHPVSRRSALYCASTRRSRSRGSSGSDTALGIRPSPSPPPPKPHPPRLEETTRSGAERVLHRPAHLGAEVALADENREGHRHGGGDGVLEQDFLTAHAIGIDIRTEQRANRRIARPEDRLIGRRGPLQPAAPLEFTDFSLEIRGIVGTSGHRIRSRDVDGAPAPADDRYPDRMPGPGPRAPSIRPQYEGR